uniref:Ovomucoid n=1 Tax=Monodelphis domestica TaxID=13616 RepID=F7CCQ3_MONDO
MFIIGLCAFHLKMKPLVSTTMLMVLMQVFQSLPTLYQGSWQRFLREGDNCGKCDLELCSQPENCLAGTVLDRCGCCSECGNREGQICDLDGNNHSYGQCGKNLECILNTEVMEYGEVPEPQCVCGSPESVCGPEGKTYENICQFNEIYSQKKINVSIKHKGPCESAPVISLAPEDTENFMGNDIIFRCEVSAYPIPHLEWKKKGNKIFLPGDDAHISIQVRGGPQKHGMTAWLQIQGIRKSDEGVYICHTRNKYGTTYASARLKVINPDPGNYYDSGEKEEYESGDYEEENKLI